MTERGLLFSAPMVRAILAGEKTQTRRPVRPPTNQPFAAYGPVGVRCPYGVPGDRLWVREAYRVAREFDEEKPCDLPHDTRPWFSATPQLVDGNGEVAHPGEQGPGRLRPGMFMCRWMSRIDLELIDVSIERVQAISDADIAAEGVTAESVRALWDAATKARRKDTWGGLDTPWFDQSAPIHLWHLGWALINGDASWRASEWVWVLKFRRIRP
jgi:hypothetical protein